MINALTLSLKIPEKLGGTFETQGSPFIKLPVLTEKLATNPLSANPSNKSNILKQFVGNLPFFAIV